jgi:hypothetical protein
MQDTIVEEAWNGLARLIQHNQIAGEALKDLARLIQQDNQYACTWHCHLSMTMHEAGVKASLADKAASALMKAIFSVSVDFDQAVALLRQSDEVEEHCRQAAHDKATSAEELPRPAPKLNTVELHDVSDEIGPGREYRCCAGCKKLISWDSSVIEARALALLRWARTSPDSVSCPACLKLGDLTPKGMTSAKVIGPDVCTEEGLCCRGCQRIVIWDNTKMSGGEALDKFGWTADGGYIECPECAAERTAGARRRTQSMCDRNMIIGKLNEAYGGGDTFMAVFCREKVGDALTMFVAESVGSWDIDKELIENVQRIGCSFRDAVERLTKLETAMYPLPVRKRGA